MRSSARIQRQPGNPRRTSSLAFRISVLCCGALSLAYVPRASATDDNLRLSNLYDETSPDEYWNVSSSVSRQSLFQDLSLDLAMATSHRNIMPAETLGANGFEVSVDTSIMALSSPLFAALAGNGQSSQSQNDRADAWRVMDADHRLTLGNAVALPSLRVRKGLPFSTEVGMDWTWLSFSHQSALSGYGRVALHEGMREGAMRGIPDLAFTLAGSRFLGNEELDLSSLEWNLSIGWSFPVAGIRDAHVGTFSPFVGLGIMYVTSQPVGPFAGRLNCLEGVTGLGSRQVLSQEATSDCETYDQGQARPVNLSRSFRPWKFNIGSRFTSGRFRWTAGVELRGDRQDDAAADSASTDEPAPFLARPTITLGGGYSY